MGAATKLKAAGTNTPKRVRGKPVGKQVKPRESGVAAPYEPLFLRLVVCMDAIYDGGLDALDPGVRSLIAATMASAARRLNEGKERTL